MAAGRPLPAPRASAAITVLYTIIKSACKLPFASILLQHGGCRLASYIPDPNFAFGLTSGARSPARAAICAVRVRNCGVKQRYSCSTSWPTPTTTPPAPPSIFTRTIGVVRQIILKLPAWVALLFPLEKERHSGVLLRATTLIRRRMAERIGWLDPLDRKAHCHDAQGTAKCRPLKIPPSMPIAGLRSLFC
jgi:hypothetical protein